MRNAVDGKKNEHQPQVQIVPADRPIRSNQDDRETYGDNWDGKIHGVASETLEVSCWNVDGESVC